MDRSSHIKFIRNNPFTFQVSRHGFSESEVRFIEKHGHWLSALVSGELEPVTNEQKDFLAEMKSRKPIVECMPQVQLWKRYLRQEIIENDNGAMESPPPVLEDDPFYSREGVKEMRRGQFKTITEQHRS